MKLLVISDFHGSTGILEGLKAGCKEQKPEGIAFTGDIVKGYARGDEWLDAMRMGWQPRKDLSAIIQEEAEDKMFYTQFYDALEELNLPIFTIPGNMDAPEERYFKNILNRALMSKNWQIVQFAPTVLPDIVIGGFGGEITEEEEDFFVLQYPGKQVEFTLRTLKYIDKDKILLFHTPPIGKVVDLEGDAHKGCPVVNSIIEQLSPKIVFCGHAHKAQGVEKMGKTIVINPGALKAGNFAVLNTGDPEKVQFLKI